MLVRKSLLGTYVIIIQKARFVKKWYALFSFFFVIDSYLESQQEVSNVKAEVDTLRADTEMLRTERAYFAKERKTIDKVHAIPPTPMSCIIDIFIKFPELMYHFICMM